MKTVKSRVLFVLVVTILTLLGLEIAARLYLRFSLEKSTSKKFQFDYYRVYGHVPGFREGDKNGDWIVINKNGFRRTTDVSIKKPANTYRIFFMGGSAAHGISSKAPYPIRHIYPNETVDAYLEKKLNQEFGTASVEVINVAVTGYEVFQHTQYLMAELLDYHPDMVIFFDGANDHYVNNPDYRYLEDFRYAFWKDRLQKPSLTGLFDYFAFFMADYSALFRGYVGRKLQRDALERTYVKRPYRDYPNSADAIANHKFIAPKQFLRSIRMNLDLLRHENVKAVVGLQPMLVLRNQDLLSGVEKAFLHKDANTQLLYATVTSELQELSKEYSVEYVDFNIAFNDSRYKNQQLFIDYCHLSPQGGEASADALLPVVRPKILEWTNAGRR